MGDLVPVPVMSGRTRAVREGILTLAGSAVAVSAVAVWSWITEPANRAWVMVLVVFMVGLSVVLGSRRTWLDTAGGGVVRGRLGLRWTTRWDDLRVLRFRDNTLGVVFLQARGRGHLRSAWIPVAGADRIGPRAQPPVFLRLLAAELERWAPEQTSVAAELHQQADHLERQGPILDSPLLRRYCVGLRGPGVGRAAGPQ